MFDRVTLRSPDPSALDATLAELLPLLGRGAAPGELVVEPATAESPATQRLHVGLAAAGPEEVRAFHAAGLAAGWTSDGDPGERPQYVPDYYGAFLLDPQGNSIEAAWHGRIRPAGLIDHVWVRVRHAGLTCRFLEATAAQAGPGDGTPGYELVATEEHLARFRGPGGGSLTVVTGHELTTGLDLTIGGAQFLDEDGSRLRVCAA